MAAELAGRDMFMLFPTGLFTGMVPDVTMCDRIEKKLREMQKAGDGVTAKTYLRSFMTSDNLHQLPEFKELSDLVLSESKLILDNYRVKRDSEYITGMWANITSPNRRQNNHVHPNCVLSGVVYIKMPPGAGMTLFHAPRRSEIAPDFIEKNQFNADTFILPPEKGRMILWQSYLPHSVDNGNADDKEDRIVIAFNVMIRGKVETLTAKTTFA